MSFRFRQTLPRPLIHVPTLVCLISGLAISGGTQATGQQPRSVRVAITEADAGPDFQVQGEYVGELNDGSRLGVQVIARGDGQFVAAVFAGGLPGELNVQRLEGEATGHTTDGLTVLKYDQGEGHIADGQMTVFDTEGQQLGILKRIVRESPTLGETPPEGAVVLFADAENHRFARGRTRNGMLLPGVVTEDSFDDFHLHLEFMLPFMPHSTGQNRGNSGVYLQNRYEVQVLDSFGLLLEDNECGALYEQTPPTLNATFPPLSWQTYDIDFTAAKFDDAGNKTANARVTVVHNGQLIQDDVEIPEPTGMGQPETPTPGPIQLQFHLTPVMYRNIWIQQR